MINKHSAVIRFSSDIVNLSLSGFVIVYKRRFKVKAIQRSYLHLLHYHQEFCQAIQGIFEGFLVPDSNFLEIFGL